MKVLITTDWYAPTVNGVVTSVLNLKKELEEKGCQVRVLTLAQNEEKDRERRRCGRWIRRGGREENVWYLPSVGAGRIYPGARTVFGIGRKYVEEMAAWKPDVIHSQCEFTTFWFARRIARATGAVLLHTYHTVYEDYTHYFSPNRAFGRKAAAVFSRFILKDVDEVLAPTDKVRRLLEEYGVDRPIRTVPSGIDCERFARARDRRLNRNAVVPAQAPRERRTLITVGRLAKEKNTEELLRWLAEGRGRAYRLLILGDGPDRGRLEELAGDLGVRDRVDFAGMVLPQEIPDWYQRGEIFVSASKSETQGLTYAEALASGLPAVCRRDECLDQVIVNGRNGWQYGGREEFFDALEALEDPGVYRSVSAEALRSAKKFDRSYFGERVLELYLGALRKNKWRTETAGGPDGNYPGALRING